MTCTKSSELPYECENYWLKFKDKWHGNIHEEIFYIQRFKGEYEIFPLIEDSQAISFVKFYEENELLAYCKIEKPEGGG